MAISILRGGSTTGAWVRAEEWAGRLAITRGQTTLDEELEIETFDGDRRFILNSAIPLVIEGEGLVGAIVVNQDITRRKQNEGELKEPTISYPRC